MRNLTEVFIESAPSRFRLPFGISTNVMFKGVSNEVRRDKNGVKINKNCYMTFATVDVENDNKITAESTFSYFNLEKPEYAILNFTNQYNQLMEIIQAVVPTEELNADITGPLVEVITAHEQTFEDVLTHSGGKPSAKFVKKLIGIQQELVDAFIEIIEPFCGDKGDLVNLLVVTGRDGQFLDLPREDKGFISKVDGGRKLTIDGKYIRWYEEKDKKKKADKDDLGEEDVIPEDELNIPDEDDLDGI